MKDKNKSLFDYGIDDPVNVGWLDNYIKNIEYRNGVEEKMRRTEVKKFDVTKYVGSKAKIATAEIIAGKYGEVIKVETEAIPFKDDDSFADGKVLTASIMLGLAKDENGELTIGIDSKADKWLSAKGVDVEKDLPDTVAVGTKIEKLIGVEVVAQKNENGFLDIA